MAVLTSPLTPGVPYEAQFGDLQSEAPTITIGTNQRRMTRIEAYEDGEPPSDLSQISIILVVLVIVALAFAFNK